jgi:YVTN family beta-propeller protein
VPVNGDVACDADISTDAAGRERFVYPTRKGDTIVTLDPTTGQVLKEVPAPAGTNPLMLTTARDGTIWVAESGSDTVAAFDPELNLIERAPAEKGPIDIVFSPDGALAYVGHSGDTVVPVFDTATYAEVARVEVGTNPEKLAVDPDGRAIYAILTREAALAVIDTADWTVDERIPLGTNPTGIFVRAMTES